jgi:ribonuclease D
MEPSWIDTGEELEQFCEKIETGPLAVDTESDHFHAYQAQVCLIQLADGNREALVDPLAMEVDELEHLFKIFENPEIVKILHSARNDIIQIDRDYGVSIKNLFDTQIAARFLDYERNSLNWMLEELANVNTGKQYTRFDWTKRPIPRKARQYAVDDVRYLADLREKFKKELEEEGWAEAFRQKCDHVARSVEYEAKEFDPHQWRKLDGSKKLDDRGKAALAELFLWRHKLCTELNKSAVTILPNGALLRLARKRPQTAAQVGNISGISQRLAKKYGEEIASVIKNSSDSKVPSRPKTKKRRSAPSREEKARYTTLRKWRNKTAKKFDIPTEFIATNATISEIAASPPESIEELLEFPDILPWHGETLGEKMLQIIQNQ